MSLQATILCKWCIAKWTSVWFLRIGFIFIEQQARIWFLIALAPNMLPQRRTTGKWFLVLWTWVRLLHECALRIWIFTSWFSENSLLQIWHAKGLSLVWISICFFRLLFSKNVLKQKLHENCFSLRMCFVRILSFKNYLMQIEPLQGFSVIGILSLTVSSKLGWQHFSLVE